MNNENTNKESIIIEDLIAANTDEIKGGPKKIFIGSLSVVEGLSALPDLEALNATAVKGGTKMPSPTTPISGPKPSSK
ncbi:MAG: hypothetical protein ACKVZH_29540 [Blastocatellia bacterium]